MNKLIITLMFTLSSTLLCAQILTPVKWAYAARKISNTEAIIMIKATIDVGWHIYSQNVADGGPVKTTFTFSGNPNYRLLGKTLEPKPITKYEKAFSMNLSYFERSVVFQQKVKLSRTGPITVKGSLEYMTCNDQKCLPPDNVEFTVLIK
ncbi:protein-disulfide reductase DsbD domain-containing protein [Mucilaginibacter sp. PAMB04274]|uniref:protein-disulfide reductase DsbD domain-containing protein n=1 Tax=Mucilaginibacter sp. PAMB04274 TaxID=3138568 RepID=UPI0031F6990C